MKKILLSLLITLILCSCAYAAASEDMNVYVRKDVFDVEIKNINSNMEKISTKLDNLEKSVNELAQSVAVLSERIDRNFDTLSSRIDGVSNTLSSRIDNLDARISDLRNGIYLGLVFFGIIAALPSVKEFFRWREKNKQVNKQSFTLEDVERLIEMKLNNRQVQI